MIEIVPTYHYNRRSDPPAVVAFWSGLQQWQELPYESHYDLTESDMEDYAPGGAHYESFKASYEDRVVSKIEFDDAVEGFRLYVIGQLGSWPDKLRVDISW